MVFPFLEPHEMFSGGQGGYAHSRSECEDVALADRMLTTGRGQHQGLGASGNFGEVQARSLGERANGGVRAKATAGPACLPPEDPLSTQG